MTEPYYVIKDSIVAHDGAGVREVVWNGDFFGSDGFHHWEHVWYRLTPSSEWSPAAAAALASARSDEDVLAAVRLDADRLLAELEDPASPTGRRAPAMTALALLAPPAAVEP